MPVSGWALHNCVSLYEQHFLRMNLIIPTHNALVHICQQFWEAQIDCFKVKLNWIYSMNTCSAFQPLADAPVHKTKAFKKAGAQFQLFQSTAPIL